MNLAADNDDVGHKPDADQGGDDRSHKAKASPHNFPLMFASVALWVAVEHFFSICVCARDGRTGLLRVEIASTGQVRAEKYSLIQISSEQVGVRQDRVAKISTGEVRT